MRLLLALAGLLAGLLLADVACGPPPSPNCVGSECICRDTTDCGFTCDEPGCAGTCESLSSCDGACGDACDLICRDTSTCDLACGESCAVTCERISTCEVDCAGDCDVLCRDASDCRVTMVSGLARYERASTCDVQCATPDGPTPATDCGGDRYACGVPCP